MSLVIICLSYCIGCLSTITIAIILFIRTGGRGSIIVEQEQFQRFHPLSENDQSKNSTINTINYLIQFLFQELKDTAKLRHYVVKKLKIEFDDIKQTQIGKIFLREISIQSFSMGKECPIFTDFQLERQDRDERKLIKEVVAYLNVDYKDGFSMTLDLELLFGYHCQLYIKIKRIQGRLRLEFRREPFSHWLVVFQDDPKIEFDIKSYLLSRENPRLARIITHQIRRIIRRKQTWPSYKIRYQPFFPSTKYPLFTEILCSDAEKLIPGRFSIAIQSCDRFSIPFDVIRKEEYPLIISIDITEQTCEDFLRIHREQWLRKELNVQRKYHRIEINEVDYIDRTEFRIQQFDPLPDQIDDREIVIGALRDGKMFLMEIDGKPVETMKQIDDLLHGNEEQVRIVIGISLLHIVRVPRSIKFVDTIRQRTAGNSNSIQRKKSSIDTTVLVMMDKDLVPKKQAKRPSSLPCPEYPEFDDQEFECQVGTTERFINICLWCEPRMDFDVPKVDQKLVLLGYTSIPLLQIVSDARMSFNRETGITLNFRSVCSNDSNSTPTELSTHKGYDRNMIHGFVTIKIRHQPEIEMAWNQEEYIECSVLTDEPVIQTEPQIAPDTSKLRFRKRTTDQTTPSEPSKNTKLDNSTARRSMPNQVGYTPSKLAMIASSTYHKLRELKIRRSAKRAPISADAMTHEDISENDLQDTITRCLSGENIDRKSLEDFFHEKSLDHSVVYAKGEQFGSELFGDLTPEERRQNLGTKIFRLQQEIELQNEIRDEMIIECNNNLTDENTQKHIQAKLDNIDEKIQALYALTLFYCSGVKYYHTEIKDSNSE